MIKQAPQGVRLRTENIRSVLRATVMYVVLGSALGVIVSLLLAAWSFSSLSMWTVTTPIEGATSIVRRESIGARIEDNRLITMDNVLNTRSFIHSPFSSPGSSSSEGTIAVFLGFPYRCSYYVYSKSITGNGWPGSTRCDIPWVPRASLEFDVGVAIPLEWQGLPLVQDIGIWSLSIGAMHLFFSTLRRVVRRRLNRCQRCGYPTGGISQACPECGHNVGQVVSS